MKKILIIEDDVYISRMLSDLLLQREYDSTAAYSGTEGIMRFRQEAFDLILLDLMLPGKTGNDVLREIREESSVPIIVLTAVDNNKSTVSLLKSGANDYVTKPFDNEILLARIEVQLRQTVATTRTIKFKDIHLDIEQYEAFIYGEALSLSKREFEILKCMVEYPKKVFTKNNLYETVWGTDFLGDDNTLNVHISKIRSKIAKKRPNEEYIQTVWGIGFKMGE